MDQKSLTQILSEGENQSQAFVADVSDSWTVATLISSFANSQGGSLWIGVKSSGKIAGIYPEGIQTQILDLVDRFFENPYVLNTKVWKNKVHFVLEVIIQSSKDSPLFLNNLKGQKVLFERHQNKTIQASKIALKSKQFKSVDKELPIELSNEEEKILSLIKKNKQLSLSKMYKLIKLEKSEIDLIVSQLVYRNLIEMDFSSDVTVYKSI